MLVADVSFLHPAADTYVWAAATAGVSAAKLWDDQKYAEYSRYGSAVYTLVPLSHESYGCLGQAASRSLNELANLTSSTRGVDKLSFIERALQELSVSLCTSSHRIVAAYAAVQTRMTGRALIPRVLVPMVDAAALDGMQDVYSTSVA